MLTAEELKDIGIPTIGQRLAILKAIYQLKLAHNILIDGDHYVPPCKVHLLYVPNYILIVSSAEAQDCGESVTVERLYDIVKDQSEFHPTDHVDPLTVALLRPAATEFGR
jgi:bZIP factor